MQIRRRSPSPAIDVSIVRYQVALEEASPNNILEEIVWSKEIEIEQRRDKVPLRELQKQVLVAPPTRDFLAALRQSKTKPALIAEVKKASPSKGVLRKDFNPVEIAQSYGAGGASCLSVLTDSKFFQGSFENLSLIRSVVDLPLLCKEFIIYPYQMYLARVNGADAILLIAAILSDQDLQYFIKIAKSLKMAALIEVHSLEELDRVLKLDGVNLIGINNRNLEDFSVNLQTTGELLKQRGGEIQARNILVVSESGIHTPEDISTVEKAGASAILVGESLVKQPDPELAIKQLFGR
ncbi:indole-3-glycerol phosphate synthase TrpC [Cylindrospermopsis curvispora]|uniref:Indole-3-glycerol phosphate synthase n=1 Tax=Cylindrospermopsis curvispora GIHE-G1 TaxID=2666332 RepID=A0A7H0EYQ6_9CYAN|nr:indole-3-glycerol phosphate synthase TrpC [Cylindrospermopsis curvispora]QNP28922.1 indole-3-glycerol phosphate synthase TrpC [Cylindrospermopsis curvispora GIHE-G1]